MLFSLGFAMFVVGHAARSLERRLTWDGQPFGPEQVGYAWALAGLFGVIWQGPALGRLVKRFGELRLNLAGLRRLRRRLRHPGVLRLDSEARRGDGRDVDGLARAARADQPHHARRAARGAGRGAGPDAVAELRRVIVGPLVAGSPIEHGLLTTWGLAAAATAVAGLALALSSQS